jgi:hypothetical protein
MEDFVIYNSPFGKFSGHLVYFTRFGIFYPFWYIFTRFGLLKQEKSGNPGTNTHI